MRGRRKAEGEIRKAPSQRRDRISRLGSSLRVINTVRAMSHHRFARATLMMIILDTSQLSANLLGAALLRFLAVWTDALSVPKPPKTESLSFSSKGLSCQFSTHHTHTIRGSKSQELPCTRMLSLLVWQPLQLPSIPPTVRCFIG